MDSRAWIAILWPTFLLAGIAEAVTFTLFDPHDFVLLGEPLENVSNTAVYTLGFFAFWLLLAIAAWASLWAYTRWDNVPLEREVSTRVE